MRDRARLILEAFGWKGLFRRVVYVIQLQSGLLRWRLPVRASFDAAPAATWTFRFDLDQVRHGYTSTGLDARVTRQIVAEADAVLAGRHAMFGGDAVDVGWPPRWRVNPTTGAVYPLRHWARISDDDPEQGDIKDVWELSRFTSTFLLARAFVLTDDGRYAEAWWTAIESWAAANPPNAGPNWRCGQETSLRAIAWCFGLSVFGDHPSATPARRELLARMLGASLDRVRRTVGYALSQRNNHAISELVFLMSLPGGVSRRRCRLLCEVLDDQFFADGSYGQQSTVYERLAVHALRWLVAVQPRLPADLRSSVHRRLAAAGAFLDRCVDPVSGLLANYGPNDGSLLLALSTDARLDGRATLELVGRPTGSRSAQEPVLWFPVPANPRVGERNAPSTYVSMRGPRSMLLTRVGRPARRAADADQQAIELFVNGRRVVIDPGTFRYSGLTPWRNPYTGVEAHSLARVSGGAAGASVGRFLRAPMTEAMVVAHVERPETEVLITRRASQGSTLTRSVVRHEDQYAVLDHVEGGCGSVRWNLDAAGAASTPKQFTAEDDDVSILIEGESIRVLERSPDDPLSGWWSPTYAQLRPCLAVEVEVADGATAWAWFGPSGTVRLPKSEVESMLDELSPEIANSERRP